jgi:hypothetical protein
MKTIIILLVKSFVFLSLLYFIGYILFFSVDKMDILKEVFFPAAILSILLLVTHILISMKSGVKKNFSSVQVKTLSKEINLHELSEEIKFHTRWKLVENTNGKVIFKSGFNSIFSFGEIIEVRKVNNNTSVLSKPLWSLSLFGFGKNYRNILLIERLVHNRSIT